MSQAEVRFSTGPLPSPESLAAYGAVAPDLVNRIVTMAERQSAHRQSIETTVVHSQAKNSTLGIVCGLAIGLAGIGAAITGFVLGHPAAAAVVASFDLVGLVSVFVFGTRARTHGEGPRPPHQVRELEARSAERNREEEHGPE